MKSEIPILTIDEAALYTNIGQNRIAEMLKKEIVPICNKLTLTVKEASAYSNIGINKLGELLKDPKCNFVLYVGKKKLIKRKEFEDFISKNIEI